MVFVDKNKLSNIKRHHCCRIQPVDEKKIEDVTAERRKYIIEERAKDIRCTIKRQTEFLLKVTTRLDVKRKEAEIKRNNLVNQWIQLKQKEEDFRSAFVEFHQFTVNNREKIGREKAKILLLRQGTEAKKEEIKEMVRKIYYYESIFDKVKQQIDKHEMYEKFMAHYVELSSTKNIRDVLLRYELLLEARSSLVQTMIKRRDDLHTFTRNYHSLLENWRGEMLKFGETLTQQLQKYDEAQRQVVYWERTISTIQENAHSMWLDMELTREALNHVICLLLIRMKARVEPDFFEKNNTFKYLLTTTEGKIIYLNKMLGDLMRVKHEVGEILKKPKFFSMVDVATEMTPRVKIRRPRMKRKEPPKEHDAYPTLSTGTSRLIDRLSVSIKRASEMPHRKRPVRKEQTSRMSYDSALESTISLDSRERAMTSWLITKEARRKGKRGTPNIDPTTEHCDPTLPKKIASLSNVSGTSVPASRRLDYFPRRFSFVTVTSDPSTHLIDEKRTRERDRIIERNFNRYEKFVTNKMDTDSSLIKINKMTGRMTLPKLNFKRKQQMDQSFQAVSLPKLDHSFQKKQKRRWNEDPSIRTSTFSSQVSSLRSGLKSKKDIMLFDDVKKFLKRPLAAKFFSFGNLN